MTKIGTMAAALLIGATSAIIPALPASAAPADDFNVCGPECLGWTAGTITWYNRTAGITGSVYDFGPGSTTAWFEAYAGSTKVDTEGRTANDESDLGSPRGFEFTIGDTNLPGGIDRIKITVCYEYQDSRACGAPVNVSK